MGLLEMAGLVNCQYKKLTKYFTCQVSHCSILIFLIKTNTYISQFTFD